MAQIHGRTKIKNKIPEQKIEYQKLQGRAEDKGVFYQKMDLPANTLHNLPKNTNFTKILIVYLNMAVAIMS